MSEEEIIKICKKIIADFNHFQEIREKDKEVNIYQWNSYDDIFAEYKQAIQDLLDLYNKEKEKNKNIEDIFVVDNLPKDQVAIIISKEYFSEYTELESNYISKDKIKEKIKILEKQQNENRKELDKGIKYLSDNMVEAAKNKIGINMSIREYLEDLLEGEN